MYTAICQAIIKASQNNVPLKKTNKKTHIPRDRRILFKKISTTQKKLQKTGNLQIRDHLAGKLLEFERKIIISHEHEKSRIEAQAVEKITENSKYFFTYAKSKSVMKVGCGPLKVNRVLHDKGHEMANILNQQYDSVQ